MVSVRHFALDSLLVACLLVAVLVGVSIPASHLVGTFLDRYAASPSPRLASAVPDKDGWLLDRESQHFIYYTQPGQSIPDGSVELNEFTYAEVTPICSRRLAVHGRVMPIKQTRGAPYTPSTVAIPTR
jgi:hypothetical protein